MNESLHFVLIPLMSPGHLIPMMDMAKLLAQHGVTVTVVTTPLNAVKFSASIARASDSGLRIQLLTLSFPALEAGLPEGCENMESLSERRLVENFFVAAAMLRRPFEDLLRKLRPPASCVVSGKNLGWTVKTCEEFGIPRIFFDGMGCFSFCCTNSLEASKAHEGVSLFDPIIVPGLPHRVELSRAKLPENLNKVSADLTEVRDRMRAAEASADGIVVNTFEELEREYVKEYKRVKGGEYKVWCIGPVSCCNEAEPDKAERGGRNASVVDECLRWLDTRERDSVVYACLGSICGLTAEQLKELGLGLEASNRPFVWAVRSEGVARWAEEEGLTERTRGRGLVVRGWVPQLAILSHPAVGAFLTHCGWNSTVEGVAAGVPLATCPLFAEQFVNEKLVVEVVGVGVSVGVEAAVSWGSEERSGVVMRREGVRVAVEKALDGGEEGAKRRDKARELAEMARRAIRPGGSSFLSIDSLIDYVRHRNNNNNNNNNNVTRT